MRAKATDLAIDGGPKAVPSLERRTSKIGTEELLALIDLWEISPDRKEKIRQIILAEGEITGPHLSRYYHPKGKSRVKAAEDAFQKILGSKYVLGVNSCTSALIAALRALGIGAGDEVIVPAYTFFASASSVAACNAIPVIAEVDESLGLDAADVEKKIGKRTRAIIAVHMRGDPARIDMLCGLAKKHKLFLVEDVAQACGGSYKGRRLGTFGDVGCFSLDFAKTISCFEGGFLVTDDEWLYTRAQSWHDTAACWRPDRYGKERREGELFCGENYRMTELQGTVAEVQLGKLDSILRAYRQAKRKIQADIGEFEGVTFRKSWDEEGDTGEYLIFFLSDGEVTAKVIEALKAEGVPCGGLYDKNVRDWHVYSYWEHILGRKAVAPDGLPWSAVPEDELTNYSPDMCPRTLDILGRSVHVEIDPHFTDPDCEAIATGINKVLSAYLS